MTGRLAALSRCFQGIIPGTLATCAPDGTPNVTFLSQIRRVDERHVAISRQFFNKTSRNLEANPRATAAVVDPVTFDAWKLGLCYVRSETDTPLFVAAKSGAADAARLLIASGAEIDARDLAGRSPLAAAVESGEADCARLLVAAGASILARDAEGRNVQRLIGWDKVALAPGESRRITVTADRRLLATFDAEAQVWRIPEGRVAVAAGSSAEDLPLKATASLTAGTLPPGSTIDPSSPGLSRRPMTRRSGAAEPPTGVRSL